MGKQNSWQQFFIVVYNITADETQPVVWNHLNGSVDEILDRFQVSELCKGWPVYRDASEWKSFRDIFADEGACIFTTWSGGLSIDNFIEVSKKGRANGDFIMHRELGTLVDLNPANNRAIGKMKTTITQRFTSDGVSFDVDCDNRFIFFCHKVPSKSFPDKLVWKVQYYKVFYEKDKVVRIDGTTVPEFSAEELAKYPEGFTKLRKAMDFWLEGKDAADGLAVRANVTLRF